MRNRPNLSMPRSAYGGGDVAFWLPDASPTSRVAYRGAPQTIAVMRKGAIRAQGDFATRQLAESICEGIDSKDYTSEYLALLYFLIQHTRYMRDPRTVELVRDPSVLSKQMMAGHTPSIDCLPADTLLLKKGHELVKLDALKPGDEIWGYDRWSKVEATWYKGIRPVDAIKMNNGSTFFATSNHLVYIERCKLHPEKVGSASACELYADNGCHEWERVRIPVKDLVPGMRLVHPDRIPFGDEEQDPDRAYVEGLYISDGWHLKTSFCISGKDGFPKEAQKLEVKSICDRLGIKTTWHQKFINVLDRDWNLRMQLMGGHAPEKHALSINLTEGPAAALLRGIMADSGANTHGTGRTFTSTSHLLSVQTRLIHKMLAVNCGEAFVSNHGGLGKNPVWRLYIRGRGERTEKALRVKSIEREVAEVPVYDLTTDDHYVYLPHADVTVSNCDDGAMWLGTAVLSVGGMATFETVAFSDMFYDGRRQYSHVLTTALEPRTRQKIILDFVAAEKTPEMLRRVKAAETWPIAA